MNDTSNDTTSIEFYGHWICPFATRVELAGWPAVEWSPAQTDEFVGRFESHRRVHQRR